jgi:hypothetical protein
VTEPHPLEVDGGRHDLKAACAAMFEQHRVTAFGGVFHVPDVTRYPALFAWDSGYHALSLRHLDPGVAVDELATLYDANLLPNGLLSHQRFVPGAGDTQLMIEGVFGPMFEGDRTPFVDPPTPAYAAARLSLQLGPSVDHLLRAAVRQLRGLSEHRVVESCPLPVVLHPFETGTEGSVYMRTLWSDGGMERAFDRFKELTLSAMEAALTPMRAADAGHGFVLYEPTMCGWYLLALEEVASACRSRDWNEDAAWAEAVADAVADTLSLLWWDEGCLFVAYDLVGQRQLRGVGAMGLLPAAAGAMVRTGVSEEVAAHHLCPGTRLWGARGFAAGVVRPGAGVGAFVQWDGNAVWGATAYWAHLLALRVGRRDLARRLRADLEALVRSHGFREFYDAWSGEPGGAGAESGFTWPALVLEMAGNEG